jgi:hypothetical protein
MHQHVLLKWVSIKSPPVTGKDDVVKTNAVTFHQLQATTSSVSRFQQDIDCHGNMYGKFENSLQV